MLSLDFQALGWLVVRSIQTLTKTWWLLASCGVFDAMHSAMNLLLLNSDGSLSWRRYAQPDAVWDMGMLALGAFGLIGVSPLVRVPLSFRPVSLLFVVLAASIGAFTLATAQTLRSDVPGRWFLSVAGVAPIGFAFSFFAVGFDWIWTTVGLPLASTT